MSEDIVRQSEALDKLAKLIISQASKNGRSTADIRQDYEKKLNNLEELISRITSVEFDKEKFDEMISSNIEIVEKAGQQYALIPVKEKKKKRTSSKRNKIECSYCHQKGHLRSRCEKNLLGLPP